MDIVISVQEAHNLFAVGNVIFIDTRDPAAFADGHIPGARNINQIFTYLSTSDAAGNAALVSTFERLFQEAGLNGDEHIITYEDCLKTRFGASCRGYYLLKLLGHNNVNVMNGGWEAWKAQGLPSTAEPTVVEAGSFKAGWNGEIYSTQEDVLAAVGDPNIVLLDCRDHDEWEGESSSPYGKDFAPRKGRIPGAIHVYWRDLMADIDGLTYLKNASDVNDICASKGITDHDKNVIIYCFKGARASNTFIALKRAGFKNVTNYFASWNEWSRNNDLPVETSSK